MEEAKEVIDLRRWYRGNGRCDSEAGAVVEGGREREREMAQRDGYYVTGCHLHLPPPPTLI